MIKHTEKEQAMQVLAVFRRQDGSEFERRYETQADAEKDPHNVGCELIEAWGVIETPEHCGI